ncbi:MAG: archease [Gammaproteobacteria bacterium]
MPWEHFTHGADIGVRGIGRTPAEAFEQAAMALTGVITDPSTVAGSQHRSLACEAPDLEILLVDWLNGVITEMAVEGLLFGRYRVEIEKGRLKADLWGEPVDPARHRPAVEIKGATYTCLKVYEEPPGRWIAQTVVDV